MIPQAHTPAHNARHTPGPWYLKHEHPAIAHARANGDDRFPVPPEKYHWGIVRISTPCGDFVVSGENDTASRRQANARLIAAAPELLAALERIARDQDHLNEDDFAKANGSAACWMRDQARSAIARATL